MCECVFFINCEHVLIYWFISQQKFTFSKSTIETLKQVLNLFRDNHRDTRRHQDVVSGVFIINFEQTAHLFLVFLLLTLKREMFAGFILVNSRRCSGAFLIYFEQVFTHKKTSRAYFKSAQ